MQGKRQNGQGRAGRGVRGFADDGCGAEERADLSPALGLRAAVNVLGVGGSCLGRRPVTALAADKP